MIQTIEWKALPREKGTKSEVKQKRREGYIPAELYGKGHPNVSVYISKKDLLKRPKGLFFINVLVEGDENPKLCILKDIQYNYLGDEPIHVDLYEVTHGVEIDVEVPVEFIGKPKGLELGGIFEPHLHSIVIRTTPKNIPEKITIDVSNLGLGEVLHVRDIPPIEGVRIMTPGDETVAVVSEPEVEVTEEETAGASA
ncbi:MAG: 50S ribosomal protein L25/general stress protein Ctc [Hydrogenothermaceae bacterium]|nr:50S ribosomal protein L25/general stress protein Ctc [Hydrogenothermaceae bacterium]